MKKNKEKVAGEIKNRMSELKKLNGFLTDYEKICKKYRFILTADYDHVFLAELGRYDLKTHILNILENLTD